MALKPFGWAIQCNQHPSKDSGASSNCQWVSKNELRQVSEIDPLTRIGSLGREESARALWVLGSGATAA